VLIRQVQQGLGLNNPDLQALLKSVEEKKVLIYVVTFDDYWARRVPTSLHKSSSEQVALQSLNFDHDVNRMIVQGSLMVRLRPKVKSMRTK